MPIPILSPKALEALLIRKQKELEREAAERVECANCGILVHPSRAALVPREEFGDYWICAKCEAAE